MGAAVYRYTICGKKFKQNCISDVIYEMVPQDRKIIFEQMIFEEGILQISFEKTSQSV